MSVKMPDQPTQDALNVLRLLKRHHNVIMTGAPATGKSLLMAEVIYWFTRAIPHRPGYDPHEENPFPNGAGELVEYMPSHTKSMRRAWTITFHQGTKHRDFVAGFIPSIGGGEHTFRYMAGPFIEAANFSDQDDSTAIVAIDEINRGPAVAIFGGLITSIETDKRKLPDGTEGPYTVSTSVLNPAGEIVRRSLSHHLYILASMNEADTSVEPLDVAFRRRFMPYRLLPNEAGARAHLGIDLPDAELPETPAGAPDVYRALVQAWVCINNRIELARGREFQLGHGVLMDPSFEKVPDELTGAVKYASTVWNRVFSHISEVFFGDTKGIASALSAGAAGSPYSIEETFFADSPVSRLVGPEAATPENVYSIVRSVALSEG